MNEFIFSKNVPDIMIVDDEPANLQVLATILKNKKYKVRPASGGKQALQGDQMEPPDLILLDINMPDMNGYEVCEKLKASENLKEIPVIFISALNETMDKVKAFSAGAVDYVTKPFHIEEVLARVETHLKLHFFQLELEKYNQKLEELVLEQVRAISESQMATIFALAKLAESRDDETGRHQERVQSYCKVLCGQMAKQNRYSNSIGHAFTVEIFHASPLHDIGKVAIPDKILLKEGKLTPEEFEVMKKHAVYGAETLKQVHDKYPNNSFINMGIEIARFHHEKWDGGGYPDGLSGENIPLSARIMSVADVYDALRTKRCYKPSLTHNESSRIIIEDTEKRFDPSVIEAFSKVLEEFREISNLMMDKKGV